MPQKFFLKMLLSSDSESIFINLNNFITKSKLLLAVEKIVFAQSKMKKGLAFLSSLLKTSNFNVSHCNLIADFIKRMKWRNLKLKKRGQKAESLVGFFYFKYYTSLNFLFLLI
jgi:hypothetical protein